MSENAEAIFGSDNQVRLTIAAATNPVVALYTLYTLRHSELDASLMRRGTNQFRQRLPVPWMRSPSARADRDGIPDRNPEHRHDDRISDSGKERLNLAHVSVFGQPSGQAGMAPKPTSRGRVAVASPQAGRRSSGLRGDASGFCQLYYSPASSGYLTCRTVFSAERDRLLGVRLGGNFLDFERRFAMSTRNYKGLAEFCRWWVSV